MSNFTTNISHNPGFQLGLTGYSAINNAVLELGSIKGTGSLLGNPGLLVTTPGVVSGEGVMTFDSNILGGGFTVYSFSLYVMGLSSGSVTVSAVANPGGTILGSVPVVLTGNYQRVVINNINIGSSTDLYLIVSTTSAQQTQFWVANVQIEPESLANPYCDGNQPGCGWASGVIGASSFQQFQNTIVATANNITSSDIVNVLLKGEVFTAAAAAGDVNKNNSNIVRQSFSAGPPGAMTDFSVASLTDPDPSQTYTGWNNSGVAVPTSGYVRSWSTFFPPQDYFVSNEQLYKRAAFMAVGWQFSNVPNNAKVEMTNVQAEILPMTTVFSAPSPTAYVLPREVETIIKPDRLNYCPNPSFEVDTTGWSGVAGGVVSQDATTSVGNIIVIDDQQEGTQKASLNVTVTNSGDGAQVTITNLIAGDTYIVSAYVQANSNITDIQMTCGSSITSVAHGNAGTGYGAGQYGSGFYGGNPPANTALPTGEWFRIYTTFQPTDSVATLTFTSAISSGTNFWIDAVLIEAGEVLGFYFDGSFGTNYFWETGGTPGLARTYFYDQFFTKSAAVTNVLQHHTPFGISYAAPVFNTPPTQ